MIIKDLDLDTLDRDEFIHFIKLIINYYYIQYSEEIELKEE